MERGLWGEGVEGNSEQKKKAFSSIFTTDTKSFIYVTRIVAMHIIFTHIGCTLFTCDMYMCRLRHINDSVLSSLKMKGTRLIFILLSYSNLIQICFKEGIIDKLRVEFY
jgi:hypothetical protein